MDKGQIFAMDYVVAISLFLLLFGILTIVWYNVEHKTSDNFKANEMRYMAKMASDQLVYTPGNPPGWKSNASSVTSLGLASSDRVLSDDKVAGLSSFNIKSLRSFLGVGGYRVYLSLSNTSGYVIAVAGEYPQGVSSINYRRIVTYDSSPAFLDTIVWENYSSYGDLGVLP